MHKNKTLNSDCIFEFFQEISGCFYLITNLEKYLNRTLDTINLQFTLIASTVYFSPIYHKKITITRHLKRDQTISTEKIIQLSENIINKDFNLTPGKKRLNLDHSIDACVIPISYEMKNLGSLILFSDAGKLYADDLLLDSIGVYLAAAYISNQLITLNDKLLFNSFGNSCCKEISVKKLLEWRLQEIVDNLLNQPVQNQGIYHEISRETEKTLIKAALNRTGNNQSKAAIFLGLNRNTLRKKFVS